MWQMATFLRNVGSGHSEYEPQALIIIQKYENVFLLKKIGVSDFYGRNVQDLPKVALFYVILLIRLKLRNIYKLSNGPMSGHFTT